MIDQLADQLQRTIAQERVAISSFETQSLRAFAEQKSALLEKLSNAANKDELRRILPPILAEAQVNAMLLADAVDTMGSLFKISDSGIYDRSARRQKASATGRRAVA